MHGAQSKSALKSGTSSLLYFHLQVSTVIRTSQGGMQTLEPSKAEGEGANERVQTTIEGPVALILCNHLGSLLMLQD